MCSQCQPGRSGSGRVYLSSAAPGVIEIARTPSLSTGQVPADVNLDLGNGLIIRSALVEPVAPDNLRVTIYWRAARQVTADYSVAVHLVAHNPPLSREDILAQADTAHPVEGWYPTSRWSSGEIRPRCPPHARARGRRSGGGAHRALPDQVRWEL